MWQAATGRSASAQARGRGGRDLRRSREQAIGFGDRRGCRGGYPAPLWFLRQMHDLPDRVPGGRAREDDQGRTRRARKAQPPRAGQAIVPDSKRPRQEGARPDDRHLQRPRRPWPTPRVPYHTRPRMGGQTGLALRKGLLAVGIARENEEEIGEAVDDAQGVGMLVCVSGRDEATFRAARYGAGDVEERAGPALARNDELFGDLCFAPPPFEGLLEKPQIILAD